MRERIKFGKFESLGTNLHGKEEHVLLIKNLKQTFNPRLLLKKKHRGIKFNQKVWLKPYVDMNRELTKKKQKMVFEKKFLSWWIMHFLEKPWTMLEDIEISNLQQLKEGII